MAKKAAAVFLNYNGLRYLQYCMPAFGKAAGGKVQAIVVDSGSSDGSTAFLRKHYPKVKLIQLPHNLGWAGGNNAGIAYALAHGADYVFVLNTDILLDKNFFSAIIKAGEADPKAGVFGCKIRYIGTRKLQAAGGGMFSKDNPLGSKHFGQDEVDKGQWNKPMVLDYIYEPAFALKRTALERTGLLDPAWFILMEGPDYCLRAKKAGFKTVYVPDAIVEHEVSGTTDPSKNKRAGIFSKFYWQIRLHGSRNGLRFMLKHFTLAEAARYQVQVFKNALAGFVRRPFLLVLAAYSLLWNIVHLPQTMALKQSSRENYEGLYNEFIKA
jgi:GT2 family glycosyltransferase